MAPDKILIVDDEPEALENCRRMLSRFRYECLVEADARGALAVIERTRPKVLLTDLRMPDLDGISLLKAAKRIDPAIQVILLTAYASIHTAVRSMRHGAFDYLAKPFTGEELRAVVRRALGEERDDSIEDQTEEAKTTAKEPSRKVSPEEPIAALIGGSAAIRAVRDLIVRVADTDANVVFYGEAGTGKESVARAIYVRSARHAKPFVPVDCLASEETLVEAQLFGSDQVGSQAGVESRAGLLELAQGGTLFLNEVGGLTLRLQAKLLRAMKEQRGRRLGAGRFFEIDLRVMAASTENLQARCSRGEFREDFYYYLNVVPVVLPPLRERPEDIEAMAGAFLRATLSRKRGRALASPFISPEAGALLRRHSWSGNIRELQHVIERAAMLSHGSTIEARDLPERFHL